MLAIAPIVLSLALSPAAAAMPATKRQGSYGPWCNALRARRSPTSRTSRTSSPTTPACHSGLPARPTPSAPQAALSLRFAACSSSCTQLSPTLPAPTARPPSSRPGVGTYL